MFIGKNVDLELKYGELKKLRESKSILRAIHATLHPRENDSLEWIDAARGINFLLFARNQTNNPEIGRNVKVNKNEGREHTAFHSRTD